MTYTKYTTLLISFIFVFTSGFIYPQNSAEIKRAREHEIIKNFINQNSVNSPVGIYNPNNIKPREGEGNGFLKQMQTKERRKQYLMNGNKIVTSIHNYGGIAPGYDLIRGVNNGVWKGSSYIFQFSPLIAAAVKDGGDTTIIRHIVSDGLWDYPNLREYNQTADTLWTFQPIPGYSDENSDLMASNPAPDKDGDGKPDSWPSSWYNPTLGKYVWPGYLEQDATNADLEVFWAMDDRDNREFTYFPFISDSMRRGLGVQVDGRALQWSNTLAENTIFFVYTVANISDKDLDTVNYGIYGDCDVGGGSPENTDDNGLFIPPYDYDGNHNVSNIPVYSRSIVYFFDPDGVGSLGVKVGYVSCKFLESPGNSSDGIDNDGDLLIDERQDDALDNDNDWNPLTDDVGIDGIRNTLDEGEGDGLPTAGKRLPSGALDPLYPGEPNFEFTDLDEADQIGLTSFNSWTWNADKVSNDESIWNRMSPGNFSEIIQNTDIVFVFGSGYISLKKGESKRISISLLFGETLDDLLITAETVQRIYNANYRFFRPPAKPTVTAIPDDRKVTLYWDAVAEQSLDPLTGKDFEGYVIYRSTDPSFDDIQVITDGKGNSFFSTPLKDANGVEAKWDVDKRPEPFTDINANEKYDAGEPFIDVNTDGKYSYSVTDWWKGYHPVSFSGRGIQYFLGNNRGLVHSYVDSNNVINGQTYYYAVVAYDHGDSLGVPPTETTKKISVDPISSIAEFDINTVRVIPGPRVSGYIPPKESDIVISKTSGISNAPISIKLLNDLGVSETENFSIIVEDTLRTIFGDTLVKNYSVLKHNIQKETIRFFEYNFSKLNHANLDSAFRVVVSHENGTPYTEGTDYYVDYERGLVRRVTGSNIPASGNFLVSYRYYPVRNSTLLNGEDGNPVFSGVRIKVTDYPEVAFDSLSSRWIEGTTNFNIKVGLASVGTKKAKFPADYEIHFSNTNIDSAKILVGSSLITRPVKYSVKDITSGVPKRIWTFLKENNATRDSNWSQGEEIILFSSYSANGTLNDTLCWGVILTPPTDTNITAVPPGNGDILYLRIKRPLSSKDTYTFSLNPGSVSNDLAKSKLDKIIIVPNPYVGYNELEPTSKLPGKTRGERRIYFDNLPMKCTIRIYTLSGDWVNTIEHESSAENGREFWNLLNRDGFSIAYGIYFAHIDAPGIGERLMKFAIIK